jgi:hypothetical protein
MVFFFFLGIRAEEDAARRRFWFLAAGLLLLQGLAFSPLRLELWIMNEYYRGRYFFWLAPPLLLAGCHHFLAWLPPARPTRWLVAAFVAVNLLLGSGDLLKGPGYNFDRLRDPAGSALSRLDPKDTVLTSNMAVQAAAYFRINSIELPLTPSEFQKLAARHRITHLYIDRRYFLPAEWVAVLEDMEARRRFQISTRLLQTLVVLDAQNRPVGELLSE